MDEDQSFRVWKLRSRDAAPAGAAFCVNAPTHEDAASQIACELSMGGFYCVDLPPTPKRAGDARIIRVVPVTTYEAFEERDGPSSAGAAQTETERKTDG